MGQILGDGQGFKNFFGILDPSRKLLSVDSGLTSSDRFKGRKLLDAYGDSLLNVNRLYNAAYGHAARMVVSHVPHLIDRCAYFYPMLVFA